MSSFSDQVVLVTGGSGNLGGAVVRAFHASGAALIVPDRGVGRMADRFPELAGSPDHLLADEVDVTDPGQIDDLIRQVVARFGRLDVLVHTIGGYRGGEPVHETSPETWDFLYRLNARSAFVVSRAVLPAMLEQGRGAIILIGSHSALAAGGHDSAYSAAKSAVARLTESMAAEYKQQGIRVNAVLPAALVSAADLLADPARGVTPGAVAELILFLCSPEGAIINGALVPAFGRRF